MSEKEKKVEELLKDLNPQQREAVVNYDAPSLIVAGAGSGKTRVLTSRVAYMLKQGVEPWRILALTFTNKAAEEMRERISQMVSQEQSRRLWMGTFHSIFLRILRADSDKLGYTSSFTIYDTADSRNLIKSIIKEMELDEEFYKPNVVLSRISLAKNNLVTPQAYTASAEYIEEDRHRKIPKLIDVYTRYMQRCKANGAMDFDDMLLNINILFKDFPAVLAKYQQQFKYLLIDEYQDTNYAQYIIIRRLAQHHSKVCVVGDDAQSIYSFRGAKIENILRFKSDFPDAKTFKLEQNYRSTQNIVDAANSVIERNKNRIEKASFSAGDKGEKIKVLKAYTDQEEAAIVADQIRAFKRENDEEWSDFALLYRTNMQSRVFEDAFRRRKIPHRIYGSMSFYQRKEVKDLLAYMHLIVNPRDDEAFKRVINYPTRGIGGVTVERLQQLAQNRQVGLIEAAQSESGELAQVGMNAGAITRVKAFAQMIEELSAKRLNTTLYEFGLEVATKSGIIGSYRVEQSPEAKSALDNIEELLNSMQRFSQEMAGELQFDPMTGDPIEGVVAEPSVTEWLQSITLLTDMDEKTEGDDAKVTMMTIHAAKGLEYKYVFIVGLEENLFPSIMSLGEPEGLEEERRLFYVALTRAERQAVLSFSESRFKWGSMEFCTPSRFLSEIDPKFLDMAFDLDGRGGTSDEKGTSEGEGIAAQIRRNYETHNRRRGAQGGAGQGGAGGAAAGRYGGGAGGRYSRSGAEATGSKSTAPKERVVVPTQKVGDGTRFKSVGRRAKVEQGVVSEQGVAVSGGGVDASSQRTVGGSSVASYAVGQRVKHSKFGAGQITNIEQTSSDLKISVNFDQYGARTLLSKFAKLEILGS